MTTTEVIGRTGQRYIRADALADQYWQYRKAGDEGSAKRTLAMLDHVLEEPIRRGDESQPLAGLCDLLGLDYVGPGDVTGRHSVTRSHRWVGNVSEHFDSGIEWLYAFYNAGVLTAKDMADTDDSQSPYAFQFVPVTIGGQAFQLFYAEGDMVVTELADA